NVLSIDRIRILLNQIRSENVSIAAYYETYRSLLLEVLGSFMDPSATLQKRMDSSTDKMLENIVITISHKMYLEKYFDLYENEESMQKAG
ncbi:MAG: hypothetical protein K6A40_02980, partial [Solobacterium sp.]|nr:hypothetical protein [Solobacterium sp.]